MEVGSVRGGGWHTWRWVEYVEVGTYVEVGRSEGG